MSLDVCNILQTICVTCMICLTDTYVKIFDEVEVFGCSDVLFKLFWASWFLWSSMPVVKMVLIHCSFAEKLQNSCFLSWHLSNILTPRVLFNLLLLPFFNIFYSSPASPASPAITSIQHLLTPSTFIFSIYKPSNTLARQIFQCPLIFCDRFYFRPDRVVMTFTLVLKDLHAVYIWRRKSLK